MMPTVVSTLWWVPSAAGQVACPCCSRLELAATEHCVRYDVQVCQWPDTEEIPNLASPFPDQTGIPDRPTSDTLGEGGQRRIGTVRPVRRPCCGATLKRP